MSAIDFVVNVIRDSQGEAGLAAKAHLYWVTFMSA
jgi:hypothetical protein